MTAVTKAKVHTCPAGLMCIIGCGVMFKSTHSDILHLKIWSDWLARNTSLKASQHLNSDSNGFVIENFRERLKLAVIQ